jgi:hypothetical protein
MARGTNTVAWANTTAAHTGTHAENLTVTNYSSGDAKLLNTLDLGACTPTVVPGDTYNLSVWYESTGTTQFALYYRTTNGSWFYWTSSPWFATASARAPAGIKVIGAVSPITLGAKFHVHSHARPLIPGAGKVKPHTRFAIPEATPGPNAKSST